MSFKQSCKLTVHKQRHSNPCQCSLCKKSFTASSDLTKQNCRHSNNNYVERTIPGQYISRDVQHLTNVIFLSTDGVLLGNQLNPTL